MYAYLHTNMTLIILTSPLFIALYSPFTLFPFVPLCSPGPFSFFKHSFAISHADDDTKSPETVTRDRVEQKPHGIAFRSLVPLRYDATVDEGP